MHHLGPTEPPIIVNDTVVADPLMTVPLRIENTTILGLSADQIVSLCYELHGDEGSAVVRPEQLVIFGGCMRYVGKKLYNSIDCSKASNLVFSMSQ